MKKDTCASAGGEEEDAVEVITVALAKRLFAILTPHLPVYPPQLHYHYFVVAEWWRWLR